MPVSKFQQAKLSIYFSVTYDSDLISDLLVWREGGLRKINSPFLTYIRMFHYSWVSLGHLPKLASKRIGTVASSSSVARRVFTEVYML